LKETLKKIYRFLFKYNTDATPKLSKFMTYTLMPLFCCFCFYMTYFYQKLSNRQLHEFYHVSGMVTSTEKAYNAAKKNERPSYNIKIGVDNFDELIYLYSEYPQSKEDENRIVVGEKIDAYYETEKGLNKIVQISIPQKQILTIEQTNEHFKFLRNFLLGMALLFTTWFVSRIYRYRKYGGLN